MQFRAFASRVGRKWTLLALAATAAGIFVLPAANAETYLATPARTIGPYIFGQAAPAPAGGWQVSDDRVVGASIAGQNGWSTAATQPTHLDDEIVAGSGRNGGQAWRLSNWYHDGIVNHVTSPAFAPVGETGALNATNQPPQSNHVTYQFWFRSASTAAEPGAAVSTTITDAPGRRMTYLGFFDERPGDVTSGCPDTATGCFHVDAVDVTADVDPSDPTGPLFTDHYSSPLVRGAWYHVVVDATFVDGTGNDQIHTQIFDANGASVFDVTTESWERAYFFGYYGSTPGDRVASDHVAFRVSANPDTGDQSQGNSYSVTTRPHGIVFDDMSVTPSAGSGFTTSFSSDRYVSAVSGSDAGDCSNVATPCLTIAYAISKSQAGNTIHVAGGTYAAATAPVIALDGLQLIGDPLNKPVLTRLGGSTNQQLLVINGAKNVQIANFDFHIDQTFVAEGILASGFVDGLTIVNNHFGASQSSAAVSSFGFRNAISINDIRNSAGLPRVDGSAVLIDGNVIDGVNATQMRSGIDMDAGLGTISNNTVTAGTHDITARFSTVVTASSATSLTIDHNTLNGRGLELDAPNAGVGAITISNNTINAIAGINGSTNYPADWSLVRLIDNQQNIPTTLSGNTFQGHNGAYRGVLIENYPGVQLSGNTFTPASGATDFVSLVVSNKEINSVSPAIAPYQMTVTALGNTFNGSGVANAGRAVEFLNDNDANGSATFGSLTFGGSGTNDPNSFDGNLRWYFHLDDYNCNTFLTPCTFLNYNGATTVTAGNDTQVRPFPANVSAADNTFAGVAPVDMTQAQKNALLAQTYDKIANPALGSVQYGVTGTPPAIVYVSASFAGASYGDAESFVSAAPACGNQTVTFGVNAFATIPDGLTHVQSPGTVCVAAGTYPSSVTLANPVQLIGPKATFAGNDSSRDGTGEAIINPSSGKPLYVTAADATVDGFTFDGATRGQTVVTNTAAAANLQFINNRITNVFGAAGILTAQNTQNWTIARNLFKDFANDTTPPIQYAQAIKYLKANVGLIEDNVFTHVQSNAMQVEQNTGLIQVLRNQVDGQTQYYTNTGLQLDGNAGATVLARDNTFTNTQNGLLIDNGSSTTTAVCNMVTNSKYGLLVLSFPSLGSENAGRVFDNALSGDTADVQNGWSANALVLGSNFYDGAAPSTGGSAALIAEPLPASPIGQAACGDNTATALVAAAGTPQTAQVSSAFAQPLVARVLDALGGAVADQSVAFSAPASGASATLAPAGGTSDYDGRVSTNATANAISGGYNVVATSDSGNALFALTNAGQPSVALTLNGPSSVVAGTPTPGYTAQLSNTGSALSENVLVQFVLSRSGGFVAGDAVIEYNTGSGYAPIPLSACGSNLCGSFGPPGTGFPVGAGYNSTTQLRFTSNRSGAVTLAATVEGVTSHTAYAMSSLTVTVSPSSAQTIAPNGQTTFSGTAGVALAPPLPSVIVTDANGNPVSGVVVTFAAAANSGTLSGAMQTTDANGIATLGGWMLDATPGTNTVTATAAGVTGSVTFTAEGAAATGALQVTITDNRDYVQFDHSLTIVATIGNNGDSNMSAVPVSDVLPPELDVGSDGWQCMSFNGATCAPVTTRDLSVTVSLPAHSSVIYLLNANVNRNGSDLITDTISATGPDGAVTATDTTEIVIFRDGFEQGGDGAQAVDPELDGANSATLDTTGHVALDVTRSALASLRVTTIARAADGTFRVEAIRIGTEVWLRLVAHGASADKFSTWSAIGKGGAMLALGNSGTQLILVGTAQDLDVTLAKAGPFALAHTAH